VKIGPTLQQEFGKPYYRLYAVIGEEQQFLLERNQGELELLTQFIAAQTGGDR